ncbi:MAG: helix-turn-helix transcriptional regulator [Clostridia bacterium]|nr:helix-turn-helix transcriptional regulator [Clostridia bacterium]
MQLGEKIRELRKERGMTQAQLAGERITRNMLCEIEKGKAMPSLETLAHIAAVLDVPAAYLLDSDETLAEYKKRALIGDIRAAYRAENFQECYQLIGELRVPQDDEISLMLAVCALKMGKAAFHSGNMETAHAYLEEALRHADATVYPTESIFSSALIYLAISANTPSPKRVFEAQKYRYYAAKAAEDELFAYMSDDHTYAYTNEFYAEHEKIKLLMQERHYHEAIPRLLALEERKGESGMSAYFLFRLYSDMEIAYREVHDFEHAYKYSAKRLSLLSAFQS